MIELKGVSKTFSNGFKAVKDISIKIENGEFYALLGPSGCGKTTILRMIAGFLFPDKGQILLDGKDIANKPPYKRKINMVFQSYALFPHMNVFDNVAYGLTIEKINKNQIKDKVKKILDLVKLTDFEKSIPSQLSGGQKQRVAVARALIKNPKVLLLDEPFSALDVKLRESMRSELLKIQKKSGVTFILVTHDQNEALALAKRLAVMKDGKILQTGYPYEIYEKPTSSFIAKFIGNTNLFPAKRVGQNKVSIKDFNSINWKLENTISQNFYITLRQEKIVVSNKIPNTDIYALGKIEETLYLGDKTKLKLKLPKGFSLTCNLSEFERKKIGNLNKSDSIYCGWNKEDMRALNK